MQGACHQGPASPGACHSYWHSPAVLKKAVSVCLSACTLCWAAGKLPAETVVGKPEILPFHLHFAFRFSSSPDSYSYSFPSLYNQPAQQPSEVVTAFCQTCWTWKCPHLAQKSPREEGSIYHHSIGCCQTLSPLRCQNRFLSGNPTVLQTYPCRQQPQLDICSLSTSHMHLKCQYCPLLQGIRLLLKLPSTWFIVISWCWSDLWFGPC